MYGAFSNKFFRYFDPDIATAVTANGREIIKAGERAVNGYLNTIMGTEDTDYVIAIDTDSLMIGLGTVVARMGLDDDDHDSVIGFLREFADGCLIPVVNRAIGDYCDSHNVVTNTIHIQREVIGRSGIWVAKKRYMIDSLDTDGVRDRKVKITGFESVRTSTPNVCRQRLKEACGIILRSSGPSEIQDFIAGFRSKFFLMRPDEIASPRGCSEPDKYADEGGIYRKGTPMHVRAAPAVQSSHQGPAQPIPGDRPTATRSSTPISGCRTRYRRM